MVIFFKDMKLYMDKYVLHSYFYALDMEDMDVALGHHWMKSMGTININATKKFLNLW